MSSEIRQAPCEAGTRLVTTSLSDQEVSSGHRRGVACCITRCPRPPDHELHGAQIFVNVSARNKFATPQVLWLEGNQVPEWCSEFGDAVRVVVGTFKGVTSPLVPVEPFTFLDMQLQGRISFSIEHDQVGIVYVVSGQVTVTTDSDDRMLMREQALIIRGTGGQVSFKSAGRAQLLFLSGAGIRDSVVVDGPFIMNDLEQVRDAARRYREGEMGNLLFPPAG